MPAPIALVRAAFQSLAQFEDYLAEHGALLKANYRHVDAVLSAAPEAPQGAVQVAGTCDLCAAPTRFAVPFTTSATDGRVFRFRDARCSGCGLPQRKRQITRALMDDFPGRLPDIYIAEQVTGHYRFLAEASRGWWAASMSGPTWPAAPR